MNSAIANKIKSSKEKKDRVYTPKQVAIDCMDKIQYKIKPEYHLYEPFYGKGVFYDLFQDNPRSYTEIDMGSNFFDTPDDYQADYIITNPPYSIMNEIITKFINMTNLKGFGILVNNLTTTPPRLKRLEDGGFYPTDLYMFQIKKWFGYQYFWFFERLDTKPKVNISFKREKYTI
jgi:hypothetical protein